MELKTAAWSGRHVMERVHLEEGVSLQCSFVASWPSFFVPNWDYWDLVWGFFLVFCMSGNGVVWAG